MNSKANDLVNKVTERQELIVRAIADSVDFHVNRLVFETGLVVDGVSVNLVDVTNMGSEFKEYAVSDVSINYSLPKKII